MKFAISFELKCIINLLQVVGVLDVHLKALDILWEAGYVHEDVGHTHRILDVDAGASLDGEGLELTNGGLELLQALAHREGGLGIFMDGFELLNFLVFGDKEVVGALLEVTHVFECGEN